MKNRFFIVIIIISIYLLDNGVLAADNIVESQQEQYGVKSFIEQSKKYTEDVNLSDVFSSSMKGDFNNKNFLKIISSLLGKNFKDVIKTFSGIIIVVVFSSILKTISENLGNDAVTKIATYIQYILITTLLLKNFASVITDVKDTLQNLASFTNTLIPILNTLMVATGSITTAGVIEPILLVIVTFVNNFIIKVLIPLIIVGFALEIVSTISDEINLDKLSKFMKKSAIWITTTVFTIFISIATLEKGVTGNIDGVTAKAGKSIVSAAIPVVGKILGDALDTVAGYTNMIKNAIGVVGIIVILSIAIVTIVKLAVCTISYYLGSAICQTIADTKVIEVIEGVASTYKVLLAVLFVVTTVLIVGVAIVMKVSNVAMT